jgi:hypothetical protein
MDLTAVIIKSSNGRGPREIILGSAYLPYDDVEFPHPGELEKVMLGCRPEGTHLIIGCDASSHHTSWGITNVKNRCESQFNYIVMNVNSASRFMQQTLTLY